MRLLYYPGCTVKRNAPDYERKALKVLSTVGVEVFELSDWYCCGALYGLAKDDVMKHVGGLRVLVKAQAQARLYGTSRLLTVCPMCYNVLKRINHMLKSSPENLETLAAFMDEEERYALGVEVVHLVEVLRDNVDKLKKLATAELKDTVVAPYYGCTLLRPREVSVDDAEKPEIMDEILRALGVNVADFPLKTECCGSYQLVLNRSIVFEKSKEIIEEATAAGANAIAVICPLCKYNLDLALQSASRGARVRVVYLTDIISQVIGL